MTQSFSADLRERVIAAISNGLSTRKAAKHFSIGISTAGAWFRRYRDHGETMARKQGQPPGSKLDKHEASFSVWWKRHPISALSRLASGF